MFFLSRKTEGPKQHAHASNPSFSIPVLAIHKFPYYSVNRFSLLNVKLHVSMISSINFTLPCIKGRSATLRNIISIPFEIL